MTYEVGVMFFWYTYKLPFSVWNKLKNSLTRKHWTSGQQSRQHFKTNNKQHLKNTHLNQTGQSNNQIYIIWKFIFSSLFNALTVISSARNVCSSRIDLWLTFVTYIIDLWLTLTFVTYIIDLYTTLTSIKTTCNEHMHWT